MCSPGHVAHVATFVPHSRSDINDWLESFGPMCTPMNLLCRFDFYDLEKFMEAISAPKDSLLARKKILLTELGRQVLADR